MSITINGGITTIEDCLSKLQKVQGVMLGRAIMDNPYLLASVDSMIYGENTKILTKDEVFEKVLAFSEQFLKEGNKLHYLGNHIINLFNGEKGARRFRNYLSKHMHELGADTKVFELAYKAMKEV